MPPLNTSLPNGEDLVTPNRTRFFQASRIELSVAIVNPNIAFAAPCLSGYLYDDVIAILIVKRVANDEARTAC
ncbi:MAG TPA: hypothetical protein VHV55_08960 [Pirellulales bacterium]|jgi:hypothetical protein|nr:hypothetical protein [Pirellulales bacterium]